MEYRCRLSTPGGEITEGIYVADSEARLRHELEQKGLCVLSMRPRHAVAGWAPRLPSRRAIPAREFLVFNQELATLLKAGMPLVQSLDILRTRLSQPALQGGARRRLREGAGRHGAVRRLRRPRGAVSRRLHRVADGRREERQPRDRAAALRGLREGHRRRETSDGLGAHLPGRAAGAVARRRQHHRGQGRARVLGLLRAVRPRAAAGHARHRGGLRRGSRELADLRGAGRSGRTRRQRAGFGAPASASGSTG